MENIGSHQSYNKRYNQNWENKNNYKPLFLQKECVNFLNPWPKSSDPKHYIWNTMESNS